MNKTNYICAFLCALLVVISLFIGGGIGLYYNLVAILVVFPGVLGATFISYPFARIKNAFYVAYNTYTTKLKTPDEVVRALFSLSVRSRYDGVMSLEKSAKGEKNIFLEQAVDLIISGYQEDEIRNILFTEMNSFKLRRRRTERLFRHMANLSPAFGIAGSVIGLISMLSGLNDTSKILENIPIALTSTLYGIFLSNLFFIPIAENISDRTQRELFLQQVVMDGVIAINTEKSSYKLETTLKSFFTPSDRANIQSAFDKIRNKSFKRRRVAISNN